MDYGPVLIAAAIILTAVLIIWYLWNSASSGAEHEIDMDEALDLMVNFLNEPDLIHLSNGTPIGGTLTIDALNQDIAGSSDGGREVYQGRRGWLCCDGNDFNSLVLAWEGVAIRKDRISDTDTANLRELHLPDENVGLIFFPRTAGQPVTSDELMTFLRTPSNFANPVNNRVLSTQRAMALIDNYSGITPGLSYGTSRMESKAVFFNETSDNSLANFRRGAGKGITHFRYFFGFSSGNYGNHCIRVILIGVDSMGNNLIGPMECVLQKSWPPSP